MGIEQRPETVLYKKALAEREITLQAQKSSLSHRIVSFFPERIDYLEADWKRHLLSVGVGVGLAGVAIAASENYPMVDALAANLLNVLGGIAVGHHLRPISSVIERREEENLINHIREGKDESWSVVGRRYPDVVSSKEVEKEWTRNHPDVQYQGHGLFRLLSEFLEYQKGSLKYLPRVEKGQAEKALVKDGVQKVMQAQEQGQIERRSFGYAVRQGLFKLSDYAATTALMWASGELLGSWAGHNLVPLENARFIKKLVPLADDIPTLIWFGISPYIRSLASYFPATPRKNQGSTSEIVRENNITNIHRSRKNDPYRNGDKVIPLPRTNRRRE